MKTDSGTTLCDVCGEPILAVPGDFTLPDLGMDGEACGICGPKVEAYLADGEKDFRKLPEGPLRSYLSERMRIDAGLAVLDCIQWLWHQEGWLDFYRPEDKEAPLRVKASCPKGGAMMGRYEFDSENVVHAIKGLHEIVEAKKQLPN